MIFRTGKTIKFREEYQTNDEAKANYD